MTRHVLRNAIRTLPLIVTLNACEAVLTLAGLGFLGFGIEPTAAGDWGYDLHKALARRDERHLVDGHPAGPRDRSHRARRDASSASPSTTSPTRGCARVGGPRRSRARSARRASCRVA